MSFRKTVFMAVFTVLTALSVFGLVDNNAWRVQFLAPVDTCFLTGDSLRVNVRLIGQNDSVLKGETLYLNARGITGGGGGTALVTMQRMTGDSTGVYSYPAVYIGALGNVPIELRVIDSVKGTAFEERIRIQHGAAPGSATTAWKAVFVNPQPEYSADSTVDIRVRLFSAAGTNWANQTLTLSVRDSSGANVAAGGLMVYDSTDQIYSGTLNGAVLNNADYVIRVMSANITAPAFSTQQFVEMRKRIVPVPVLIPLNPAETSDPTPELSWHPVDGADYYVIQIDTLGRFTTPLVTDTVRDTSYIPHNALKSDTYYWRVRSNLSPVLWSSPSYFTVLDAGIPVLVPYEPDPTSVRKPTLVWHNVEGASVYTVQIDTSALFLNALFSVPTSDTFLTSLVNLPMTRIYWRVKSDLSGTYSAADNFLILPDTIPVLVRFNGDTLSSRKPLFVWHTVGRASYYTIQISHQRNFSSSQISTPTSDTFYTPLINLDTASKYYWRVSCDLNNAVYSPIDSFIVITRNSGSEAYSGAVPLFLTVSPNPFGKSFIAELKGTAVLRQPVVFSLYNVSGARTAVLASVKTGSGYRAELKAELPAGVYFLRAVSGGRVLQERVFSLR